MARESAARATAPVNRPMIQAKKLLITWPKFSCPHERLHMLLASKGSIKFARICTEPHEDGTLHMHAAVEYKKKLCSKNMRMFDIDGAHPNIQSARNWPAALNYVKKGDNYTDYEDPTAVEDEETEDLFELAATLSYKEFYTYCLSKKVPIGYANIAWQKKSTMFTIPEGYENPEEASMAASLESLTITEDNRSIVIIGPSGCGKTTWAKRECKKPSLLVSHIDALKNLDSTHNSVIFDDMVFSHWPAQAQIHLVDRFEPRSIHVRYGTVDVPAGIQKIFTCNEEVFSDHEAINRRVKKIEIKKFI